MDTHVIKLDRQGNTRRTADVRRKLVEEFRAGGGSVAEFCTEHGIRPKTFYKWLAKDRREDSATVFQEVEVPVQTPVREVRICLPNRVEVYVPVDSPEQMAIVLREAAQCLD